MRNSNTNLGPLGNHGGPTLTHVPVPPSAAIEAGDDSVLAPPLGLTTDQRGAGFPRRKGPHVDSGAVEQGLSLVVTTTDDHNDGVCSATDCTLREALNAINDAAGGDISFAPGVTGTIQLGTALAPVTANLVLQGPGANLLTVRRNTADAFRIFTITNGTNSGPSVSLAGITIKDGLAPSGAFPISSGGGILNDHGSLTLENCVLSGNRAASSGFTYGGAIFNYAGGVVVRESTLAGNTAYYGGGLASVRTDPGRAQVFIFGSTLSGNTATGYGGGVYNQGTNAGSIAGVQLANSTLSGNSAAPSSGGLGGAIFNTGATSGSADIFLEDCTLSGNNANAGGGIYNFNFAASALVTLRNTILRTGATGENLFDSSGGIDSLGHNLSNDAAAGPGGTGPGGFLRSTGDIRNTDLLLGPLQDNGGPTFTHALLAGSAAINGGSSEVENSTDQRGYLRVGANDIGAFEFGGICLRITSIARAGNDITVTFDTAANLPVRLERKLSLSDAAWQRIPGVSDLLPATDGTAQITDPGAVSLGKAFYREVLLIQ